MCQGGRLERGRAGKTRQGQAESISGGDGGGWGDLGLTAEGQ